jgi:hypothetical protein
MNMFLVTVRTEFDFISEELGHTNELNGSFTYSYLNFIVNG